MVNHHITDVRQVVFFKSEVFLRYFTSLDRGDSFGCYHDAKCSQINSLLVNSFLTNRKKNSSLTIK